MALQKAKMLKSVAEERKFETEYSNIELYFTIAIANQ